MQTEFVPLNPPKRILAGTNGPVSYKIYSSAGDFVVIEADTAADAIEKSGMENPLKVVKVGFMQDYLIDTDALEVVEEISARSGESVPEDVPVAGPGGDNSSAETESVGEDINEARSPEPPDTGNDDKQSA